MWWFMASAPPHRLDEVEGVMQRHRIIDHLTVPLNRWPALASTVARDKNYIAHGEVQGDCDIQGALLIAEGCRWRGNIHAQVVIIKGRVEGNIQADDKLELRDYCQVYGSLSAPLIAIGHLAKLRGEIDNSSLVSHFPERRAR